jgi:hypothetical protein
LVWALSTALAAWAGVEVTDPTGCLDAEMIEIELRAALGDEVVEDVELAVRLADGVEMPSEGGGWTLSLDATDRGSVIWRKEVEAQPVDCPYLTQIVVMSVERGLTDLPGFLRRQPPPPPELAFLLAGTLPWAIRVGIGGDLWVPSRRAWASNTQLEIVYQAVEEFGPGRAQVAAVALGTGLGVGLPLGRHELRGSTRLGSGANVAIGLGQEKVPLQVRPRLVWSTEVGVASASGIRAAARLEVNALRLRYAEVGGGQRVAEPLLRGGIVLALAGPLRLEQ